MTDSIGNYSRASRRCILCLILFVSSLVLSGCGGLQSVEVEPQEVTMDKGETQHFELLETYKDGETKDISADETSFRWKSTQPDIVSVDPRTGKAEAISDGKARVHTEAEDSKFEVKRYDGATVHVLQPVQVQPRTVKMQKGETKDFKLEQTHPNGKTEEFSATEVPFRWKSSQPDIVSVDPQTGKAEARSEGEALVYTDAEDKKFQMEPDDGASVQVRLSASYKLGTEIGRSFEQGELTFRKIMQTMSRIQEAIDDEDPSLNITEFTQGLESTWTPPDSYSNFGKALAEATLETEWREKGQELGGKLAEGERTVESVVLLVKKEVQPLPLYKRWSFLRGIASGYGENGIKEARSIYATVR